MEYDRTPVELQSPDKAFTDGGKPLGLTALDYWRFQFSNFWDMQEEIAEFLVAKALELELPHNKNGWTPFDIRYKGKRIEIKSSSYFHSWRGDNKVSKRRVFSIAKTIGQHSEKKPKPERQNDVYVFCLNTGNTFADSDPFELNHWEFYVVPTAVINNMFDDRNKVSIDHIRDITKLKKGVPYCQLKSAIDKALR